jgi:hypothetical protein
LTCYLSLFVIKSCIYIDLTSNVPIEFWQKIFVDISYEQDRCPKLN